MQTRYKHTTIDIHTSQGMVQTKAYIPVDDDGQELAPGFAVHHRPLHRIERHNNWRQSREWSVTHIPSGYSVTGIATRETRQAAFNYAIALAQLLNWNEYMPDDELPEGAEREARRLLNLSDDKLNAELEGVRVSC